MQSHTGIDTIWHTRTAIPTPLGLASQLGWLREEFAADGIAIRMVDDAFKASLADTQPWLAVPNLIHQGGNAPAIWARAHGIPTRVIGLSWIDESQLIFSLADSGIRHPRDLRGRRIGIPQAPVTARQELDHQRASALRGVLVALELAGLTYKDVELIDLRVKEAPQPHRLQLVSARPAAKAPLDIAGNREIYALIRREVDAIYIKGPQGVQMAHDLQLNTITDIRHHPDPLVRANCATPRPIVVGQDFLARYPELVERFLTRIVAIGTWARVHPQEVTAFVARQSGTTEHWARTAYGANLYKCLCTNLDATSVAGMDAYKAFLLQWGFLKQDFETADWIDPRPLAAVCSRQGQSAA